MDAEGYDMEILRKIDGFTEDNGAYILKGDAADVKVYFLTDEVIRIRAGFDRQFPEESYVLMTTAWGSVTPLPMWLHRAIRLSRASRK